MNRTDIDNGYSILVPARMVNEYVYCPRLAYIEWVQGEFEINADVAEGRLRHRRVDVEKGDLPEELNDRDAILARSIWLSAPSEHLTARIDLLEGEGGAVFPVDYKRGPVPEVPERAWDADMVQLCCQGLVLRSNGYACEGGFIYYAESKTRVHVHFDEDLVHRTREAVKGVLAMANSRAIPQPLVDSPKCFRCSLASICLPDETNMLAGRIRPDSDSIRRILPARDDSIPLYVQKQGARIGKNGDVLEIRDRDAKIGEARIFETSHVALFGNVNVTIQAMQEMCVRGIPITLFSTGGWFYGIVQGMTHKNVELRMAQYRAALDDDRCLRLARGMISAKIDNCRTLLMRNHKSLPDSVPEELKRLSESARSAKGMDILLGVEGMAARIYFGMFKGMLKDNEGEEWSFDFNGRNRRPPLDPVNAMLSYAYSLLVKDITVTLLAVGFDPYLGFYHTIRYGRPSLGLDLMEEFRPIIADSVVIWVVNNRVLTPDDFIRRGKAASLTQNARKKFISAYERRIDSLVTHPVFGYRVSYRRVLEVQARLLGRYLTGEIAEYPSFRTR